MQPVKFEEMNAVYGAKQPEYQPLPAHKEKDGTVTTCWQLNKEELKQIQETGVIWFRQLTFNQALQPILPLAEKPKFE